MKTEQETFDTVVTHLASMTHRAIDADETCMYRAPDGNKCAVGCLISDDEYRSTMEGSRINAVKYMLPSFSDNYGSHVDLLTALQIVHDNGKNWSEENRDLMKQRLKNVAHEFILSPDIIDTLTFVPIVPEKTYDSKD